MDKTGHVVQGNLAFSIDNGPDDVARNAAGTGEATNGPANTKTQNAVKPVSAPLHRRLKQRRRSGQLGQGKKPRYQC
jgi:hypothetical protein